MHFWCFKKIVSWVCLEVLHLQIHQFVSDFATMKTAIFVSLIKISWHFFLRLPKSMFKVLLILSLSTVMARIEPVFLARNTRDAAPDPHRTYYSHSHSHYQPRYRSRGSGIPGPIKGKQSRYKLGSDNNLYCFCDTFLVTLTSIRYVCTVW